MNDIFFYRPQSEANRDPRMSWQKNFRFRKAAGLSPTSPQITHQARRETARSRNSVNPLWIGGANPLPGGLGK